MNNIQGHPATFLAFRKPKRPKRPAPYDLRSRPRTTLPVSGIVNPDRSFVVDPRDSSVSPLVPVSHRSCTEIRFRYGDKGRLTMSDIWNSVYCENTREKVKSNLVRLAYPNVSSLKIQDYFRKLQDDTIKEYFRIAPEIMIEFLAEAHLDPDWLNSFISRLDNLPQEKAFMHLIAARQYRDTPLKSLVELQGAVLSGWSHPLPYLTLIAFHVERGEQQEAYHIYEMYRLVVIFHRAWDNPCSETIGADAWHRRERFRLESLFKDSLSKTKNSSSIYLPTQEKLIASLTYWSDELKREAQALLFNHTLHCPWNMHKPILKFTEAVVDSNIQKWTQEGCLTQRVEQLVHYINHAYAPGCLDQLFRRTSDMLVAAEKPDIAINNLYWFIDRYNNQAVFLHAASLELARNNISVKPYNQEEANQLISNIRANGNEEEFIRHLNNIRLLSKDVQEKPGSPLATEKKRNLVRIWNNIPSLQNYSAAGSLSGTFESTCLAGLKEAHV